jgi:hypothetical protein
MVLQKKMRQDLRHLQQRKSGYMEKAINSAAK